MMARSLFRLVAGWSLLLLDSIAILFALYVMSQSSWNARLVGVVLILCPLLLILYPGFLLLRPPPPEVWSSIRERLGAIAKARPLSTLLRPRWGNLSVVVLYLVATALLNSPSQLEGMDSKSVVVSRQIPVALQMGLLGEIGALAPLDALVGHFGIVPAYILLVFLGVAGLYLLTSLVAHALYLMLGSLAAVAGRLARWHGSGSGRRPHG